MRLPRTRSRSSGGVLTLLLLLLLNIPGCASSGPGAAGGVRQKEEFTFIVMADPQFGYFTENRDFAQETVLFTKAIAKANRLRPAFVVVNGDLQHKPGDEPQAAEFKRIAAGLDPGIRLRLVGGNHDMENTTTPESLAWYRRTYGPDWYSFDEGGWHFVVCNTNIIRDPSKVPDEEARQWQWLEEDLKSAHAARGGSGRRTILFGHQPLFMNRPDEADGYNNMPRARRAELLRWCREYGVAMVFAGHLHRCGEASADGTRLIITGPVGKPLGRDPSGFGIVKVSGDEIEYRYVGLEQE